jgi:hypothetical protein
MSHYADSSRGARVRGAGSKVAGAAAITLSAWI